MYLLGYPKPLRYLNLLLEWITSEASTSVVDSFFRTATPDRILCLDFTLRMRWGRRFESDGCAHHGQRCGGAGRGASAG